MTENTSRFVTKKKYHIVLQPGKVKMINDEGTYFFQSNESLYLFEEAGKDVFPDKEDIKEIFNVAKNIDLSKWIFRIESEYAEKPFIQQVKPNKFKKSES